MKIVIATGLYPPQIGGPATYAALLHQTLPERGFEVAVVNFGAVRTYPKGIRHLLYLFRLLKASRGAALIYALDPVSVGFPVLLVSKIVRIPYVVKIVGDYAWEQGTQRYGVSEDLAEFSKKEEGYGMVVHALKKVQTAVARHATQVVVPSLYLKRIVVNWGVSPSDIVVIPNAFEGVSSGGNKAALRTMLGFEGALVVSAGRLVPWKGFATLIAAFADVRKHVPDAKLVIAGEGPEREKLESSIEKYGLEEAVILTGALRQDILHSYIRAADAFVLNTGYEGFSHLLLEVLALETPLITTTAGGNTELVRDGEEALLITYNDKKALTGAIIRLLTDTPLQSMLIRKGKERVGDFGEEAMLRALMQTLTSCGAKK